MAKLVVRVGQKGIEIEPRKGVLVESVSIAGVD